MGSEMCIRDRFEDVLFRCAVVMRYMASLEVQNNLIVVVAIWPDLLAGWVAIYFVGRGIPPETTFMAPEIVGDYGLQGQNSPPVHGWHGYCSYLLNNPRLKGGT